MLKIGHRGAAAYVAENTLESIQKAMELGVDGIEIDVHLCASGELVVFHDVTLDRITNGSGEISEWTLDELKVLLVNDQFKIPTLTEVLDLIDRKCLVNIELKGMNTATDTYNLIKHYIQYKGWAYDHFIVSSFQHHELETIYKLDQNILLGVLTKANIKEAIEFAATINAYAIHPNYAIVSKRNIQVVQDYGYKVFVWTVNMIDTIKRMKKYGVDGIISDKPDRL